MVELLMSMHTHIINLDAGNLITFREILGILSLIYKHYKRDFLQNNGITTKNLNLALLDAIETCLQFAYPSNNQYLLLRSAVAGRLYKHHSKHTSNSGFD